MFSTIQGLFVHFFVCFLLENLMTGILLNVIQGLIKYFGLKL